MTTTVALLATLTAAEASEVPPAAVVEAGLQLYYRAAWAVGGGAVPLASDALARRTGRAVGMAVLVAELALLKEAVRNGDQPATRAAAASLLARLQRPPATAGPGDGPPLAPADALRCVLHVRARTLCRTAALMSDTRMHFPSSGWPSSLRVPMWRPIRPVPSPLRRLHSWPPLSTPWCARLSVPRSLLPFVCFLR
jgi:hypothetical protein